MTRTKVSAASARSAAKPESRLRKPAAKTTSKSMAAQTEKQARKPAERATSPAKKTAAAKSARPSTKVRPERPNIVPTAKAAAKASTKKPVSKKTPHPQVKQAAVRDNSELSEPLAQPVEIRQDEPVHAGLSEPLQAALEPVGTEEADERGSGSDGPVQAGAPAGEDASTGAAAPLQEPAAAESAERPERAAEEDHVPEEIASAPLDELAARESVETGVHIEMEPEPEAESETMPETMMPSQSEAALEGEPEPGDTAARRAGEVIPFRRPAQFERAVVDRSAQEPETFLEGDFVVYPTHGVGKVERIAVEEIAGHKLELIHITFEENRMTLRVPVAKARSAGLRKLASRTLFDEALAVLKGRARIKRTMWSRRAQEYEAKINSGDPLAIAEVVRDLHRNAGQPDQSFSERQIYEAAMDRLAAEMAALEQTDKATAAVRLAEYLKTQETAKAPTQAAGTE